MLAMERVDVGPLCRPDYVCGQYNEARHFGTANQPLFEIGWKCKLGGPTICYASKWLIFRVVDAIVSCASNCARYTVGSSRLSGGSCQQQGSSCIESQFAPPIARLRGATSRKGSSSHLRTSRKGSFSHLRFTP